MRQLAVFKTADQARTLAAYLVTQKIAAHAEEDGGEFSVWVRDEDQLSPAREALAHFRANPTDPRYAGVESAAVESRRRQEADEAARQKNVIEMRGRWKSGPGIRRKSPVTIGLIIASVLTTLGTEQLFENKNPPNALLDGMRFISMRTILDQAYVDRVERREDTQEIVTYVKSRVNNFADIQRGHVWRLVTPIFIHYGLLHLLFNMWVMYVLGAQIDDRLGAARYAGLILLFALGSCLGQAITDQWLERYSLFGGMSGVAYGVFGYLWMKVRFDPGAGYYLDRFNIVILMSWLVLCILREYPPFAGVLSMMPNAANAAHVAGLVLGMAVGYLPIRLKRR